MLIRDYPKSLKVGKARVKIRFEEGPLLNDDSCRGYYEANSRLIVLRKGMGRVLTARTFIHEYLHAVEDIYKVAIPHAVIYDLEEPLERFIRGTFRASFHKKRS